MWSCGIRHFFCLSTYKKPTLPLNTHFRYTLLNNDKIQILFGYAHFFLFLAVNLVFSPSTTNLNAMLVVIKIFVVFHNFQIPSCRQKPKSQDETMTPPY